MTRRKDGRWQQQMTILENGRPKQKFFYGKTKAEVLRKIATYKDKQERGELFKDIAELWWNENESSWAPSTLKPYKPAFERAVDAFGNRAIASIKASDIAAYIKTFTRQKSASQKTVKTQLSIIRMICQYAVERDHIPMNPAREVSLNRNLKKTTRNPASSEDIQRIKDSVHCTFGLFAYLLLYTGMRRGEALALDDKDFDWTAQEIRVTKSLSYEGNTPILRKPKTEAGNRVIPILSNLEKELHIKPGILFSKNGNYLTQSDFQVLWKRYQKESGVTCTPHQIRHTFATMLFENDISIKDAQGILGHAQASTTQDIYTHIRELRETAIKEKIRNIDIT